MRVYVDITGLKSAKSVTGIQRVVQKLTEQLAQKEDVELFLLEYDYKRKVYLCPREDTEKLELRDIPCGSLFLDLDNVWNMWIERASLYRELKDLGVHIGVMIYDLIPLTYPQYAHKNTVMNFIGFFGAVLEYADFIITNAEYTSDKIKEVAKAVKKIAPPIHVMPLGSNILSRSDKIKLGAVGEQKNNSALNTDSNRNLQSAEIVTEDKMIREVIASSYYLCVGTIEPRKNHATILKAFEEGLFEKGYNLVIVGRFGWDIGELKGILENHPKLNSQLFVLNNTSDTELELLYKHAKALIFASFVEGYGIPIVEALMRGVPVIASDIPVLHEVGGEYCEYFDPYSSQSLVNAVSDFEEKGAHRIDAYMPYTWEQAGDKIHDILNNYYAELNEKSYVVPDKYLTSDGKLKLRQIYMLAARAENIIDTLAYIEAFMPYIEEVVLGCPDFLPEKMEELYKGRLKLVYATDSELLNGEPLPKDHAKRNFLLRCRIVQSEYLDEVFIMTDDDYRPLEDLPVDIFYDSKLQKFTGYYCYLASKWMGTGSEPTSYDKATFETVKYSRRSGYPTYQFASHQPQIICREIFREMIKDNPGIEYTGHEEWDVYFDYMLKKYPASIQIKPYVALTWPCHASDWPIYVRPEQYLVENYYEENYHPGGPFENFSKKFTTKEEILKENEQKKQIYDQILDGQQKTEKLFADYKKEYQDKYFETPGIAIVEAEEKIYLPSFIRVAPNSTNRLPMAVLSTALSDANASVKDTSVANTTDVSLSDITTGRLNYIYTLPNGPAVTDAQTIRIELDMESIKNDTANITSEGDCNITNTFFTVWGLKDEGVFDLVLEYSRNDVICKGSCRIQVVGN